MWHKFQECWCGYSAAAAAGEGLTGEVDAPQPPRLLWARAAGKQERGWFWGGGTSQLFERLQNSIAFHTMHKKLAPLTPPSPRLHRSAHSSLSAFFSPFLFSPPPTPPFFLPSGDTPTHWAEPVPLDLCCSGTSCEGSAGRHLAQLTRHSCLFFQWFKMIRCSLEMQKHKGWSFKFNFIRFSYFHFSYSGSDINFKANFWVHWCARHCPLV